MQEKIVNFGSNSIAITVEALESKSFSDLIRTRRPGKKFQAANGKERAIAVSYKDLIVLTRFSGQKFGPMASAVDQRLRGAVEQEIENSGFRARQGETLVVNLESHGIGSGNARKILVIGLGDPAAYSSFVYCGLIGKAIEECVNLESEQVMLLLPDLRSEIHPLSGAQFSSVLVCRIKHHLSTVAEHGRLKKIRLIVDPEMNKDVESGLTSSGTICRLCSDPTL